MTASVPYTATSHMGTFRRTSRRRQANRVPTASRTAMTQRVGQTGRCISGNCVGAAEERGNRNAVSPLRADIAASTAITVTAVKTLGPFRLTGLALSQPIVPTGSLARVVTALMLTPLPSWSAVTSALDRVSCVDLVVGRSTVPPAEQR